MSCPSLVCASTTNASFRCSIRYDGGNQCIHLWHFHSPKSGPHHPAKLLEELTSVKKAAQHTRRRQMGSFVPSRFATDKPTSEAPRECRAVSSPSFPAFLFTLYFRDASSRAKDILDEISSRCLSRHRGAWCYLSRISRWY